MNQDHCLYCGSSDIIPVDEEHYLEQNLHILQCRQCRVMFTELEQRLEADSTPLDYKPDFDVSDEDATLDAVWKQWNKSQSHNLELLFQHKHPLKHPVEFMIYRDLWQVVDAANSYEILTPDKNYDHCYACEHLHSMLINNLRLLEYFLSTYTEEQRLCAMRRLYKALGWLRGLTIYVGRVKSDSRTEFAVATNQQRVTALTALAGQLEDIYEAGHDQEYLKMAGRLWNKCLGSGRMYNEYTHRKTYTFLLLPESQSKQINLKNSEISRTIHQIEPGFLMSEPPSLSWVKEIPWFYILLAFFLNLLFCVGLKVYEIFSAGTTASTGELILNSVPELFVYCGASFLFLPVQSVAIWIIYGLIKSCKIDKKNKLKREQIYNRLYKNGG